MGEIDELKQQIIGFPAPYTSKGEQACELCDKINQVTEWNKVPPMQEAVFEDGDEILFRASRKDVSHRHGGEDDYFLSVAYHAYHDGEYDDFAVGATQHYHDVLGTAVLERRGVDFGKLQTERLGLEYRPDPAPDALTLTQVEVQSYSGPDDGDPEQHPIEAEEPPDPLYDIPELPGYWPAELQRDVAQWVVRHQA